MGRLSNPSEHLKHLVDRGSGESGHGPKRRSRGSGAVAAAADPASSEETGRLSNPTPRPVQRRLGRAEIDTIISNYQAGQSLRAVAKLLGVHHHTVAAHLQRHGIARRLSQRKMTDIDVAEASRQGLVGFQYLEAVTLLLQRIRSADPTAGLYEAADLQWWWSQRPRATDNLPQLFLSLIHI